jgi:hypothetical protein
MIAVLLVWILGILFITAMAATATVVYAALVISGRTDAMVGECASGEEGWAGCPPNQPQLRPSRA